MPSILNLADQLLSLARQSFERMDVARAKSYLDRLMALPGVAPSKLADASFLLAQCHYQQADFAKAETSAARAVSLQPDHADSRYLLARSASLQEKPKHRHMLEQLARAESTAVRTPRQASALGRALARVGKRAEGLKLLRNAYASEPADPVVVEDFVEGLLAAKRLDDAELVAKQAEYRHQRDSRFRSLRHRLRQRLLQERLAGTRQAPASDNPNILPFRNFEAPSEERPTRRARSTDSQRAGVPKAMRLDGRMDLVTLLGKSGPMATRAVYAKLGLAGDETAADQRRAIAMAMRDPRTLASVIRELPADSKKLLKTLVRAGGLVPATVLFQLTGPDAPPPDYAQSLLDRGLLFFGHAGPATRGEASMAAVVPMNLLPRLATILKIRVGE